MNAVERLQRQHGILRAKLNALESALRLGPETWFVLREMCHTLSCQLHAHIDEEERLIAAANHAFTRAGHGPIVFAHHDEPILLRDLKQLFVQETGRSLDRIKSLLIAVIDQLRRHMDEEERTLFPDLEQALQHEEAGVHSSGSSATTSAAAGSASLVETMTINRILCEHPETASVFRDLFIDWSFEGCDCVDEVAWRHGLEGHDLITRLEQAMCSQPTVDVDHACCGT